jgi:hypothetical protein
VMLHVVALAALISAQNVYPGLVVPTTGITQVLDDSDVISPADFGVVRVASSGGAVTLTSTPSVGGVGTLDGETVLLVGVSEVDTITLQSGPTFQLALSGGINFTLGRGDSIFLAYEIATGMWREISRSDVDGTEAEYDWTPTGGGRATGALSPLIYMPHSGRYHAPTAYYAGETASGSGWAAHQSLGPTLVYNSGTAPTYNVATPFGTDASVKFNSGAYYTAPTAATADITPTTGIVVHLAYRGGYAGAARNIIGKRGTANTAGWEISENGDRTVRARVGDGTSTIVISCTAPSSVTDSWGFFTFVAKPGHAAGCYLNRGETGGSADLTTFGSMSSSTVMSVGAGSMGAGSAAVSTLAIYSIPVADMADFTTDTDSDGTEDWRQMHYDFMDRVTGTADGRAVSRSLRTFVRASVAHTARVISGAQRFFAMAPGVQRVHSIIDPDDNVQRGLLVEEGKTNLLLYSEDFASTNWWKGAMTAALSTGDSPFVGRQPSLLTGTSINGIQRVGRTQSTAASVAYVSAVYVKKAGWLDYVALLHQSSTSTILAGFHLPSCTYAGVVAGGFDAPAYAGTENAGDGWCRIYVRSLLPSTSHVIAVQAISSLASENLPTDARNLDPQYLVFGGYLSESTLNQALGTYIPTTTATVLRNADEVSLYASPLNHSSADLRITATSLPNVMNDRVWVLANIGTGTADRILLQKTTSTSQTVRMTTTASSATQADIVGTTVIVPMYSSTVRAVNRANDFQLYVDGTSQGTDTSGSVPTPLTYVTLGESQYGGIIQRVRVFPARSEETP